MEDKNLKNNFNHPAVIITILILIFISGYLILNKNQNSQEKVNNNLKESTLTNLGTEPDLPQIVKEWTPRVAQITCYFKADPWVVKFFTENNLDYSDQVWSGSGFVTQAALSDNLNNIVVSVMTNRHVITGFNGMASPKSCDISLPEGHTYKVPENLIYWGLTSEQNSVGKLEYINGKPYYIDRNMSDSGHLTIKNPDSYITNVSNNHDAICKVFPEIGDKIAILGYPGIGSNDGITATEGIISGIEKDYFVTSAKVEHGNSGGVAIFIKKDCYFGIPSYTISGEVESLARILDVRKVFDSY